MQEYLSCLCVLIFFALLSWSVELLMLFLYPSLISKVQILVFWTLVLVSFKPMSWVIILLMLIYSCELLPFWEGGGSPFTVCVFPQCILCFTWSFWFFFFVLTLSLHFAFYLQRIVSAGLIKAQGSVWCHGCDRLTSPIHNFKITIEIQLKSPLSYF